MKTITLRNTKHIALAAAAALCVSSVAVGAYAGEAVNDVPTRTVRYSDLNLGTQAGATALYNRIRHAAEEICGDPSSRQLADAAAAKACVARAISSSVHSVHSARLASVYDEHFDASGKTIGMTAMR